MILPTYPTFLLHAGGGRRVPRDPAPFLGLPPPAERAPAPVPLGDRENQKSWEEGSNLTARRKDPGEDGAESVISFDSDGLLQRTQADGPVEVLRSERQTYCLWTFRP